jgi:zinc protease
VRQLKHTFLISSIILLIISLSASVVCPQSGRGRPTVPRREPATPPLPPPKVPASAVVVKKEQAGNVARFVLQNGMTVIVSEQHAAPLAAAVAYFKVGASDEPPAARGVARVLARLGVRGTTTRPAARLLGDLRAIGALAGVTVTADSTSYTVAAPPERLKEALALQSDMIQNPALADYDLRGEAALAHEEEKVRDEGSDTLLSPAFRQRLFNQAGPTAALTREQLLEFHRTYYRPENLIVTVAGDVSTFNALIEIQQLYGGVGDKAEITPKPSQVKPKTENSTTTAPVQTAPGPRPLTPDPQFAYSAERADISRSILSVGFRAPGLDSKEWPALEVLAALVGQGRGSRLDQALIYGQPLATRVLADYLPVRDSGLIGVELDAVPNSIDKAESTFFKEISRLRRETPTEGEMARAKSVLEKRHADRMGSLLERARLLARAEAAQGGFRAALDYRKIITGVTGEDVRRAAARYLMLANTSVHEMEPTSAPARTFDVEGFSKAVIAWAPGFAEAVDDKQVQAANAAISIAVAPQGRERAAEEQMAMESVQPLAIKDFSTLNGPKAFVREDHSQPVVTIALLFQGGRVTEDDQTSGATELMLRLMMYGTPRRTYAQVWQELEQLGAQVDVISEPDFYGFIVSVLSRNDDRALRIVRDFIEEPALRDEDIERARAAQIGLIRRSRDAANERARELFFQALYPAHPYALPTHGREEVVAKLTGDQLRQLRTRAIERQLPLAVIVGDTDGSALVSAHLAEGFRRREIDETIKLKVPQKAPPAERMEPRRISYTVFCAGFAGPKGDSADVAAFDVIEAVMNGPGGRLASALTDKQAAARFELSALLTGGAWRVCALTAPENEQRARAALLGELERFASAGITSDELASARAVAATMQLALMESQKERALGYAREVFFQRQASHVDSFAERLSKVTAEDIKRVASTYFKPQALSVGIVRGKG